MTSFFYSLNRHHWAGATLSRWLQVILLLGALFTALGWVPGGWPGAVVWLALFGLVLFGSVYWQKRDYVQFEESSPPTVVPAPLDPTDKIPIFATGRFSVEGKTQRFTWLQGFFRTFATREHAALCLAPESSFLLLGTWPEREVGMWYCFFMPDQIEDLRWGHVQFDSEPLTCVAVDYQLEVPKQGRFSRAQTLYETFYLACPDPEDAQRILADLLHDQQPVPAADRYPSNNGYRAAERNRSDGR